MHKVIIDGVLYAPVNEEKQRKNQIPEMDPNARFNQPDFNISNLKEILPTIVSDLKHEAKEADRQLNQKNLARNLYKHVIRNLYDENTFAYKEKGKGQEHLMIKGYTRDVWSYLDDAYDLIHDTDLVALVNELNLRP